MSTFEAKFHESKTAAEHAADNTQLGEYEIAVASDTGAMKIGPGFWNGLTAIGEGPKVYRALLTQTGTAAPVAMVLENTLGEDVTWEPPDDTGVFRGGTIGDVFTENKTWFSVANRQTDSSPAVILGAYWGSVNAFYLQTGQLDAGSNWIGTNELIPNVAIAIEIIVYP